MLYIFAGLPGAGKTTLARHLARTRNATHLRIDTIEQALRDEGAALHGPEGYVVAYRLAADNLALNHNVVADSVNPLSITRKAWRDVALRAGVRFIEIEVICSNASEHRSRVESRVPDIFGLLPLSWKDVQARHYEPWDSPRVIIDTAGKSETESLAELDRVLAQLPRSST
jgi:predicted kinase